MLLLYNTMYLRCAIILSILKIVLSCHIDKPVEENSARRGGNNSVVNGTLTSDGKSTIDDNGMVDEIIPPKLALKVLDLAIDVWANREELKEKGRFLKRRQVVTCDGFVLTIFRLTGNVQPTKIPVLLMHGLYQSSDLFAKQSKDQSMAFKLQDLGYDVWLGNLRGNKYSRHHMYLDPEEQKEEFFNSTYEEMGIYDLAATVDFILNETDHSQLHFIGYSIGGTVFLVLNSMEPWHNAKFKGAHLMAPIGYQKDFPLISRLRDEAKKGDLTYDSLVKSGIVEIFPYTNESTVFLPDDCLGNHTTNTKVICQRLKIKEKMDLKDQNNGIEPTRGGSIKQLAHIAQNVKLELFSRWDYGERENENRYGTKIPPEYILSRVTVPTVIIFAIDDEFVGPKDMIDMARDLMNGTARAAGRSNFTHEDFHTAPDVYDAVYENIIKDIEMNSNQRIKEETTWSSTFCKRYFWPIFIILIIIILILLGFLMACFLKEKEEKEPGLHVSVAEPTADTQNDGPLASDRDLFIDDDGSGLEIDESSGSGWGPGPGPDDEDGRGSGDAPGPTLTDDEDYPPTPRPTTTTPAPEPSTVEPDYVAPRVLDEKPSPGAEEPRGAGEQQPSRPETDISISSGEDVNPGADQDPSGTNVGAESRPQDNVVFIMNAKPEDRATSFFAQPGILAAVIGGAVVGLLCAILVVMFIVYRMRKKDEGSYALDEPKRSPAAASYGKGQNNREFYA